MLSVADPASAQTSDCAALRARIDAAGQRPDADLVVRQNRAELERLRAYADESGCSGGSVFDDPDSAECHALLRRADALRQTIARALADDRQGGVDDDRRAAIEDYNVSCTGGASDAALPTPDTLMPVEPTAPDGPAPAAVPSDRIARVFCVRQCDGAFYPLAVDVPTDELATMDQLCKAQCPNAESSAYTAATDGAVAEAQAVDGTNYASLPTAFQFQKASPPTCACRAPGASWATTLAKAEAMIAVHKGDVVVTPELQASMAIPKPLAGPSGPVKTSSKHVKAASPKAPAAGDHQAADPGQDSTRELRRSVPTL